jgi:hypothetical protein
MNWVFRLRYPAALLAVLAAAPLVSARQAGDKLPAGAIDKGQRVFVCGHSFHVFIGGPLTEMAQAAGYKDHVLVDTQFIGGSRTLLHWNLPDDKNKAKAALKTGKVDVLTLSPTTQPDEGIDNFVKLALEHNANIRVTVQESWAAWDSILEFPKGKTDKVDRNKTPEELKKIHEAYFKSSADQIEALDKKLGKKVVFLVPAGHATVMLRERIHGGKVAGLKSQEELFADPIGHARPPLAALVAYTHYAVIYRRSPVGLPMPGVLKNAKNAAWDDNLNRQLQEIAWEAVTSHPLSGVKAER